MSDHINFKISGSEKFKKWVQNVQDSEDIDSDLIFSNALNIGRLAIKHADLAGDPNENGSFADLKREILEQISSRFDNTTSDDQFDDITESINSIMSEIKGLGLNSAGSSKKGAMGEKIIFNKLQSAIPEWKFEISAHETASTDIQATKTDDKTGKTLKIMIEVKAYSAIVPKKEITKFHRDLNSCRPDAALFISLSSGITGNGNYEYEQLLCGNKSIPVIMLSHAGMSGTSGITAFLLLEQCLSISRNLTKRNHSGYDTDDDSSDSDSISTDLNTSIGTKIVNSIDSQIISQTITNVIDEISCHTERLESLDSAISKNRSAFGEIRKKIVILMDEHYKSLLDFETSFKHEVIMIRDKFCEVSENLSCNLMLDSKQHGKKIKNHKDFVSRIESKRHKAGYEFLWKAYSYINDKACNDDQQNSLEMFYQDGEIAIRTKGVQIAKTVIKTQGLQLVYSVPAWDDMTIAIKYEISGTTGVYFLLSKIKDDSNGFNVLRRRIRDLMTRL